MVHRFCCSMNVQKVSDFSYHIMCWLLLSTVCYLSWCVLGACTDHFIAPCQYKLALKALNAFIVSLLVSVVRLCLFV